MITDLVTLAGCAFLWGVAAYWADKHYARNGITLADRAFEAVLFVLALLTLYSVVAVVCDIAAWVLA